MEGGDVCAWVWYAEDQIHVCGSPGAMNPDLTWLNAGLKYKSQRSKVTCWFQFKAETFVLLSEASKQLWKFKLSWIYFWDVIAISLLINRNAPLSPSVLVKVKKPVILSKTEIWLFDVLLS